MEGWHPGNNLSDQLDSVIDALAEICCEEDVDPYTQMIGWITDEALRGVVEFDEVGPSAMLFDHDTSKPIAGRIHGVWFKIIDFGAQTGASFGVWILPEIVCHHVLLDYFEQLPSTAKEAA